jgi:hypothetical protein
LNSEPPPPVKRGSNGAGSARRSSGALDAAGLATVSGVVCATFRGDAEGEAEGTVCALAGRVMSASAANAQATRTRRNEKFDISPTDYALDSHEHQPPNG